MSLAQTRKSAYKLRNIKAGSTEALVRRSDYVFACNSKERRTTKDVYSHGSSSVSLWRTPEFTHTLLCIRTLFSQWRRPSGWGGKDNLFSLNINPVAFWRHVYLRVKSISVRTNIISMSAVLCDLFGLYYASEHGEKVSKCPLLTEEETQCD